MKEPKEHSEDICHCGDYRSDHPDNGVCDLNGLGHGWGIEVDDRCLRFRLADSAISSVSGGEQGAIVADANQ
jgi:hypothetical protein